MELYAADLDTKIELQLEHQSSKEQNKANVLKMHLVLHVNVIDFQD